MRSTEEASEQRLPNMTDSDKQASAEHVEGRRVVSQNTEEFPALQAQRCIEAHHASMGLDGVRKIAKASAFYIAIADTHSKKQQITI